MSCQYRLYGLTVQSAFPLPGVPTLHQVPPSFDVILSWKPETEWQTDWWYITHASSDPSRPEFGQADDGSVYLAWGNELKVTINANRNEVCVFSRIAKLKYAPTVVVGFVFGYLLHLSGQLCLHGALLGLGGRTIAILGDSGAGKSTIAAALIKNGARLLSDDLIAIPKTDQGVFVHSGCLGLRLTSSSVEQLFAEKEDCLGSVPWLDKKLLDMSRLADDSYLQDRKLDALYFLESAQDANGVSVGSPLPPLKALQRLIAAWYPPEHLRLLSQERLLHIQLLAHQVPLQVIRYAKQWDSLPALVDFLTNPTLSHEHVCKGY